MDLTTTTLTVLREQSNYSHFHIILGMVLFLLCLLSFLSHDQHDNRPWILKEGGFFFPV